jgi:conjugal transfer pilus assembly protein TraU
MIKRITTIFLIVFYGMHTSAYAKQCTGAFVNPITDICWKCLFPITIGKFELVKGQRPDTRNPGSPICVCPKFGIPVPGIVGGFWEPVRLVDVSSEPYCFVNMGGLKLDMGIRRDQGGRPTSSSSQISRWYTHYYAYPILYILELVMDILCLEQSSFDLLWVSELDPTGMDDDLASILNPEAFLFNNLLAQAACSADCTATSLPGKGHLPIDSLFWCSGCQGTMYPLNGSVNAHIGGIQASLNATTKVIAKMHRLLFADNTSAETISGICQKTKAPVIKKSQYRYQLVNPDTTDCYQLGRSTTYFESNKEIPITREDFGYLIWRKRNCCVL